MKPAGWALMIVSALCGGWAVRLAGQPAASPAPPPITAGGRLPRPADYREWIWVSSGIGMAYTPPKSQNPHPSFDNVFVTPAAYRAFLQTGRWPDQTMFVLELRASQDQGSILKQGRYQGRLLGIEVEIKDQRRFPNQWGFFEFPGQTDSAAVLPPSAACYSCHAQQGAVDNTFVQFYPALLDVARQKGTLRRVADSPVR